MTWRKFLGLGLQGRMPDATTLVRFRQRLLAHGLHEELLDLVNQQLDTQGLRLRTCTLVDATLVQAARRPPQAAEPPAAGACGMNSRQSSPGQGANR